MKIKVKVCKGCGSVLNAVDQDGNEVCAICIGIDKNSGKTETVEVDLGQARCAYCKKLATDSEWSLDSLPFYNARDNTYYCGCRGWD